MSLDSKIARCVAAQVSALTGGCVLGSLLDWRIRGIERLVYIVGTTLLWYGGIAGAIYRIINIRRVQRGLPTLGSKSTDLRVIMRVACVCVLPASLTITARIGDEGWLYERGPGCAMMAAVLLVLTNAILSANDTGTKRRDQ